MLKSFDKEVLRQKLNELPYFEKAHGFVKKHFKAVKISAVSLVLLLVLGLSVSASGLTLGYNIKYNGKIIATVESFSVYEKAEKIANSNVFGEGSEKAVKTAKISPAFTFSKSFNSAKETADAIINNSEEIVLAYSLVVNGREIAVLGCEEMDGIIDGRLNEFCVDNADNETSFVEDVSLEEGYFVKSNISDAEKVKQMVSELNVKTVANRVTDTPIPYETKTVKTNKQDSDYKQVTTKGQNGISRKVEVIESINGMQVSCTEVSNEIIASPVTEVVTVGTAPVTATSLEKSKARSAGFICPLANGSFQISAYWGDGRGHKGIDLATPKGSSIYCVASGKVEFAGYDGAYGYSVVIDHGNGLKTRYAHASALYVSAKQTVEQGDVIAGVGRTGSATGNHLHFEVIVNGTRVNPAPYIPLK